MADEILDFLKESFDRIEQRFDGLDAALERVESRIDAPNVLTWRRLVGLQADIIASRK